MTEEYKKRHPFILAMRNTVVETLKDYPKMTLKGFLKYFDGMILQDEIEELKRTEEEQLRRISQ